MIIANPGKENPLARWAAEHRVSDRYSLRMEYLGAVWPTKTVSTNGGSRYDQKDGVSFLSIGLNLHY